MNFFRRHHATVCSITGLFRLLWALYQHSLALRLWSAPLSILTSQRVAYGIFALQWAKEERDLGGGVLLHFTSVAQSKVCHRGFQKFPNWSAGWKRGASFERTPWNAGVSSDFEDQKHGKKAYLPPYRAYAPRLAHSLWIQCPVLRTFS